VIDVDLKLASKNVVITASTSGIGRHIAEGFLCEGANVMLSGRDKEKGVLLCNEFSKKYPNSQVYFFPGDLTEAGARNSLVAYAKQTMKQIDILVGNLGSGKPLALNPLAAEELYRFMDVNFISQAAIVDCFLPMLQEQQKGGIVLISSIAGLESTGAPYGYAAAKSGLVMLCKSMAKDLAGKGIRINCVAPGNVYFEGGRWEEKIKENEAAVLEYINKSVPMKRFAEPEEIADAVLFLSSERASFTTGHILVVDGGETRSI
jgi:3-oxoacyl-[acyl-carrier protein] reductase